MSPATPAPPRPLPPEARVAVICGPTASGKSAAAMAIAERVGGAIVSCDSVAVYRGFDIGAAKPTRADRARVPHHLLDVADPDEDFTAARFVIFADAAIAACAARGQPVIVAGGTGLYLRALLRGIFEAPPPDPALRERLKLDAARLGWPAMHARLAGVDPAAAARIHPNDPVRIARALEVFEQTGEPLSAHHARQGAGAPRYASLVHVIDPPRPVLDERITARVGAMLAAGLAEETRALRARWPFAKAIGSVGYRECAALLDGALAEADLPEAIRLATRGFARRQRTWFRKEPGATVVASAEEIDADVVAAFLRC